MLTTGLSVNSANADVINSDLMGNGTAVTATGTGSSNQGGSPTTGATTMVRLYEGNVIDNTTAFNMVNPVRTMPIFFWR